MALVYPAYAGLILANTAFVGPQAPQMANGIALGVTTYLLANPLPLVTSVGDIGAPGAGVGAGVVLPPTCAPPVLYGILQPALAASGIVGPQSPQLALGLSVATCTYLLAAQSVTAHAGVGAGTGIGNIIGVEPAGLSGAIIASTGFVGPAWPLIVTAFSTALVTFLMSTVKFSIVITGPAGPGAATGTGTGRIL
jgi:hypothetical protein